MDFGDVDCGLKLGDASAIGRGETNHKPVVDEARLLLAEGRQQGHKIRSADHTTSQLQAL